MIKYAKSDIRDGMSLIRIGIGNIITGLLKGETESYEVPINLDYIIVHQVLKYLFPESDFRYNDNTLYIEVESYEILIRFESNKTTFSIA